MPNYKEPFKKGIQLIQQRKNVWTTYKKNNILFTRYGFDCLHDVSAKIL